MKYRIPTLLAVVFLILAIPTAARAHCDTLGGPVIADAKTALEKGDITPVLKWVSAKDEAEIRDAFTRTVAVRKTSPEARDFADRYFFETLVRVHRQGEGAPYTGLKSEEPEAVITAADLALEKGTLEALEKALVEETMHGLRERFETLKVAREHAGHNVDAGRRYVAAYVDFMHYAEKLHQVAVQTHGEHAPAAAEHQH
jgi:hypothetical protein